MCKLKRLSLARTWAPDQNHAQENTKFTFSQFFLFCYFVLYERNLYFSAKAIFCISLHISEQMFHVLKIRLFLWKKCHRWNVRRRRRKRFLFFDREGKNLDNLCSWLNSFMWSHMSAIQSQHRTQYLPLYLMLSSPLGNIRTRHIKAFCYICTTLTLSLTVLKLGTNITHISLSLSLTASTDSS